MGSSLATFFLDIVNGYVQAASHRIGEMVQFPPGYYMEWAGQFEYLQLFRSSKLWLICRIRAAPLRNERPQAISLISRSVPLS
jgi:hypothetical protein